MTQSIARLALILTVLLPGVALGRGQEPETNVNARYTVESVSITGVPESAIGAALRDRIKTLVGVRYDPDATEHLANRIRGQLPDYDVAVKVRRGDQPEHVKVTFEAERVRSRRFEVRLPPLVYYSHEGFSGAVVAGGETHHNYLSAGLVSDADERLERDAGFLLRYEHRRVGTDAVQIGVEFDYYHPSFEPETGQALLVGADVPGIYRTREAFAPTVSVIPIPELKLTVGASFQTLGYATPLPDQAAHAFTADLQFRSRTGSRSGLRQTFGADYSVRSGSSALGSDFLYTRQLVAADYVITLGRQSFGFHAQGGQISGRAPLFERFSLGNSLTLRGWDKFDVAPLGGARLAYGSLEYRYRPFQVFYDIGTVWDPGQPAEVKHSVGIGLVTKDGFFLAIGFPVRLHQVTPAVMFGFRGKGRG
jgi:hypothetical protein